MLKNTLKKHIITILLINSICLKNWEILPVENGFFNVLKKNRFLITLFLENSENCEKKEKCKTRILEKVLFLEKDNFIKENDIKLIFIDYNKKKFFKEYFNLLDGNYLFLFSGNKIHKLFDFDELLKKKNNFEKNILDFIKDEINSIAIKIKSFGHLKKELSEKKIITIFFGKKNNNKNFEQFYNLSINNQDDHFFYTENPNIKITVFYYYLKKNPLNNDNLIILKDNSNLTRFDNKKLVIYNNFLTYKKLDHFFSLEKNQKMILKKKFIDDIINKKIPLFLYLGKNIENDTYFNVFENIVMKLPKQFIFTKCFLKDKIFSDVRKIFLDVKKKMIFKSVYLIYYELGRINLKNFEGEFDEKNILNFVKEFYYEYKNQFLLDIPQFNDELENEKFIKDGL